MTAAGVLTADRWYCVLTGRRRRPTGELADLKVGFQHAYGRVRELAVITVPFSNKDKRAMSVFAEVPGLWTSAVDAVCVCVCV